jgi:hypothetical protein
MRLKLVKNKSMALVGKSSDVGLEPSRKHQSSTFKTKEEELLDESSSGSVSSTE